LQDFLWNVQAQTGKTLLTPPLITASQFQLDQGDVFTFMRDDTGEVRKFVKRLLKKASKKLKKKKKPAPFEWLIQSIVVQKIFPPVSDATLFFYLSIFEDLRFLYGAAHLPVPKYDSDLYFGGWVTACGYDYRLIWPVIVHIEIFKKASFDLFIERSFIVAVIVTLFRKDDAFLAFLGQVSPRTPEHIALFFRELPKVAIGVLPRWSLYVVLVEVMRRFPESDAVYFAFANLLYQAVIRKALAAQDPAILPLMDSSFELTDRRSGDDLRAAIDTFTTFQGEFVWASKGLKVPDVTQLVTYLFMDPPALGDALINASLDRDIDEYSSYVISQCYEWP
jgi:hypothetical protein